MRAHSFIEHVAAGEVQHSAEVLLARNQADVEASVWVLTWQPADALKDYIIINNLRNIFTSRIFTSFRTFIYIFYQ